MTDLVVFHDGIVDSDGFEPPPPRRRGRVRTALALLLIVGLVGVVATFGFAAPGLYGIWTSRSSGGVPDSIRTPWTWQANATSNPPGPASVLFTGVGSGLVDDRDATRGRIAILGRSGSYRSLYPDHGRWTAGGNVHLSAEGRYVASLKLHGDGSAVSITDLVTGEVRNLPPPHDAMVTAVYGWRPDGGAVAIGYQVLSPLDIGVVDIGTGETTPLGSFATVRELAGDVSVAFSPDGQRLAVAYGWQVALFDTSSLGGDGYPLRTIPIDRGQQFSGVFTPDSRRLVLFGAPYCQPPDCPPALTWSVSYLDVATGVPTTGPTLRPFSAAAVRAVGWNETTDGLVVVALTATGPDGATDRDARQLNQPGQADLYELSGSAEPRLLLDAPASVTGLDVAADLVRAGRFGDRASVPSLLPIEFGAVAAVPVEAAIAGVVVLVVVATMAFRPRRRSARSSGRRRYASLTQRPTVRRTICCSWCGSVMPSAAARSSASVTSGMTGSNAAGSSEKPLAETVGPPTTLPVTESTTTVAAMKPPSPRIRRSVSSDSPTSPTARPST